MVLPAAITPSPTLPAFPGGIGLAVRQAVTSLNYTGCDLIDYEVCVSPLADCYNSVSYNSVNYETGYISCACAYEPAFLSCYFSTLSQVHCNEVTDTAAYVSSRFMSECGSIPSGGANGPQQSNPTSISLDFAPVVIVTATGPITQPTYVTEPNYSGAGSLLSGSCAEPSFTLVDAGSTVLYAPFVGCVQDRPECCPWTAAAAPGGAVSKTGSGPATTSGGGYANGAVYPQPVRPNQQVLAHCAADYSSVGGVCCPNGYLPFTGAVGGQTPCWSSLPTSTTVPTLTRGLQGQPSDTSRPTSAVINIVWAVEFPVQAVSSTLSGGAIAGISIGGILAAVFIAVLSICLYRARRQIASHPAGLGTMPPPPVMYQQQQPYFPAPQLAAHNQGGPSDPLPPPLLHGHQQAYAPPQLLQRSEPAEMGGMCDDP